MKEILIRNKPIFIIGAITLGIFVGIIVLAQKTQSVRPVLIDTGNENLISNNTQTMGNKDAKHVIVEFSDYECPACKEYFPKIKALMTEFKDEVYFGYRHFPLPQHEYSKSAAIAAVAASKQGKFWEYSEKLFANQDNLNEENFVKFAQELNLNLDQFKTDIVSQETAKVVQEDLNLALKMRINSTPTFFLNGKLMKVSNPDEFRIQIRNLVNNPNTIGRNSLKENNPNAAAPSSNINNDANTNSSPNPNLNPQTTQKSDNENTASESDSSKDSQTFGYDIFTNIGKIIYTEEGFKPKELNVGLNAKLTWVNTTKNDIYIEQLVDKYDEFKSPKLIKAGESFEFTMYKDKIWTYQEKGSKRFGSITVN